MVIAILVVLGLALGSFVNALVWRVHEQAHEAEKKNPNKKYLNELSISKGRSMCPDCKHTLQAKDLVPLFSWLSTRGKCRYCKKPISIQYPLVESVTAALFIASYLWWPDQISGARVAVFALWLLALTGLMALLVYDARWYLLPNRIMFPVTAIAVLLAGLRVLTAFDPIHASLQTVLAVLVGGGIFYALYQVSKGKWIGGGDVKLGWVIGLLVGTPAKSMLVIFLASFIGVIFSIPLLGTHKMKRTSTIPFGPFLIVATVIAMLFGHSVLHWYQAAFMSY